MDAGAPPTAAGALCKRPAITSTSKQAPTPNVGKPTCPWFPCNFVGYRSVIGEVPVSKLTDYSIEGTIGQGTYG